MPGHTITDLAAEGTLLKLTIASTPTLVGQRLSLDPPDAELQIRTVTNLDSTSVKKRPGLPNLGKAGGKLFYDPNDATHILMRSKVTSAVPTTGPDVWTIVYPDGFATPANDLFSGYLVKFKPSGVEVNGTLEAEFEIEITDSLVSTPGTP